ncbi:DUF262 domain-containing HNH endonuclease family protein [Flavobacterium sp.]|uniref:DUF262 domain-containing protein n=1 Tax=Flavobacterium sp. TaxID=239 RepID=UPI00262CEC57|nr:DUF262 domain-containing HNH endonuclease family protein [Flavobacterium sp.]
MGFTPSIPQTLRSLFHGNRFVIPDYQRKYSWGFEERKDLWDDVIENLELKHFIGTLCFMKDDEAGDIENEVYQIIDGQQRVTTLFILMNCLIEALDDETKRKPYTRMFIGNEETPKLIPLGEDADFINKLIFKFDTIFVDEISVRSQRHLYNAKIEFKNKIEGKSQEFIVQVIEYITNKIDVLIFDVEDHSQAVKMFTVINDRGLQLNNLDKTKSSLMFYSTLYLEEKLNDDINKKFGKIFDYLDNVIIKKDDLGILSTIDVTDFENTFYTHHYYSSKMLYDNWDYQLGANSIYKRIKDGCESFKHDTEKLYQFIDNYITDFESFAKSYSELFNKIEQDVTYQQYFRYLQFTATMFPLLIRLFEQEKLEPLFKILETVEVRIYKLKNTNPRSNIYRMASDVNQYKFSVDEIKGFLIGFTETFLNDYLLEEYLAYGVDNKQALVKYILCEYNKTKNNQQLTIEKYSDLQIEHIFSRGLETGIKLYGFGRKETYDLEISLLGNLTILESKVNVSARNAHPRDKEEHYNKSSVKINHLLAGSMNDFDREKMKERNSNLIEFVKTRFSIE